MNTNNYVVIMAGGAGTRLWPFSREKKPKQFQDLLGTGKTLIQQTIQRFEGVCPKENIYIVTGEEYRKVVKEQLPFLQDGQILAEPNRRNTAPCLAYACYKITEQNPEANIAVSPADQVIFQEENFREIMLKALSYTEKKDVLVTIGIKPTRPDTGFGYIQFIENGKSDLLKVKTFTEKPELSIAKTFVESGEFVWNAGIFVWNGQAIRKAFEQYLKEIHEVFEDAKNDSFSEKAIKKAYSLCKSISIDYGIMERADNVYMVQSNFDWSDLGTWKSVYEISEKNEDKNLIQGNVLTYKTKNCIVKTPEDKLVILQGLDNFIIIDHENVLLVCNKDNEQQVRDFVADAKNKGSEFV